MRPIDAVQVLKDINWHHKPTPVSEFESGFNQGLNQAMWIITHAPTLTPPTPAPPCYQPDGDGCGYQCYDGDDEPIDKCKECPLCYSDKQRHHTPPNEPEYREYTCPNCHHTWLEDRDATDYPEYCPGCGEPLNRRAAEGEEGDVNYG